VHVTDAVFAPFNPLQRGTGFVAHDLEVLALWAVGSTFVAVRWFRWEPRR